MSVNHVTKAFMFKISVMIIMTKNVGAFWFILFGPKQPTAHLPTLATLSRVL
jgi:hypothetical protein